MGAVSYKLICSLSVASSRAVREEGGTHFKIRKLAK
jgi:hypothetical protein